MITYIPEKRVFKLDTRSSTYVIGVYDEGYLLNLYYGAPIPDANLSHFATRLRSASFSPSNPRIGEGDFSPDSAPLEYPGYGSGDFRVACAAVKNPDGNCVTDLRYVSHRIIGGKPSIAPLPHVYANDDSEAETLELTTEDAVTGVRAVLSYTVFPEIGAMTKSVRIENHGPAAVSCERVMSGSIDLPSMDFDLVTLYGRHASERSREQRPLAHGLQGIRSLRGSSSHNHNPFAALLRHGSTEESGDAYGFNLVYSGNFEFCAECDYNCSTRVVMGIEPTSFSWKLEPGDSFQSSELVMVYSNCGEGGMSRIFHRLYSNNLVRGRWKHEKRPLLINSWEAALFDFDTDKLVSFARHARDAGMDMLVMDDGWFGVRSSDNCSLGDWYVNEDKLPGGLAPLIERVNALGLKFGIWYEPEMISPDSDLYRAHPDWCVHVPGREPSIARNQYVLDVSREDVRENIFNQISSVLSKYKIDYVKWDFNRNLSEAGSELLPSDRQGEFFHRFVLGTYELMDRLTSTFPDILLENCSGGGGRFDPAMLYYSPQIWTSDNTDPIERLAIQFGTSLCYPASTMGAHVSACRRTGYETKGNVALWGTFGYELDPNRLTAAERDIVREQVAEYHKYYELIHRGDLYRLIDPYFNHFRCAWSFVAPDKSEALVTVVTMRKLENSHFILRLAGLDPDMYYREEVSGEVYSGALLMNAGIKLTGIAANDGDSVKLHFVKA